jgi:hypothetical protein
VKRWSLADLRHDQIDFQRDAPHKDVSLGRKDFLTGKSGSENFDCSCTAELVWGVRAEVLLGLTNPLNKMFALHEFPPVPRYPEQNHAWRYTQHLSQAGLP